MPTGTIARLLIDKGFGFIRDEGGIEHFFHRSSVRGAVFELLREGHFHAVLVGRQPDREQHPLARVAHALEAAVAFRGRLPAVESDDVEVSVAPLDFVPRGTGMEGEGEV